MVGVVVVFFYVLLFMFVNKSVYLCNGFGVVLFGWVCEVFVFVFNVVD